MDLLPLPIMGVVQMVEVFRLEQLVLVTCVIGKVSCINRSIS